eukprot:TRINITY_DN5940_c0_g1_i1.p1 TRINITY_DN5940_c0_g1~~TRINITY_DN5940_c0_g1_i1.p1  ORF type:complete len:526 (+),score=115.97 TRINITY_DN5940_c0_g1_i1:174-1751(+)
MITQFLRTVFALLKDQSWDTALIKDYMSDLTHWCFFANDKFQAKGVSYHLIDKFLTLLLECLPLENETLDLVFEPVFGILARSSEKFLFNRVKSSVFNELLENGKRLLKSKEKNSEEEMEVQQLGFVALKMGFSQKFFELASNEETPHANRKVLFALYDEFSKLEKQMSALGVELEKPVRETENVHEVENANEDVNARLKKKKRNRNKKNKDAVSCDRPAQANDFSKDEGDEDVCKETQDAKKRRILEQGEPTKSTLPESNGLDYQEGESLEQNLNHEPGKKKRKSKDGKTKLSKRHKSNEEGTDGINPKKIKGTLEIIKKKSRVKEQPRPSGGDMDTVSQESQGLQTDSSLDSTMFNDSVISNLQREFEKVSSELRDGETDQATHPLVSPSLSTTGKKKKKIKGLSKSQPSSSCQTVEEAELNSTSPGAVNDDNNSNQKSKKKVRFSMKNNLVWKPHSPLPPESVRVPPSATPRGSALKKGVPPGPIRPMMKSSSPLKGMKMIVMAKKRITKLKTKSNSKRSKK